MTDAEFSPDGTLLAASGKDGTVTVRAPSTGHVSFVVNEHRAPVTSLAFIDDGRYLLSISPDNGVVLATRVADGQLMWRGQHVNGATIAAARSGGWFATAGEGGRVRIWKRGENELSFVPSQTLNAHRDKVHDIVFIERTDVVWLATAGADKKLAIWRQNRDGDFVLVSREAFSGEVRSLSFNSRSNMLAFAAGKHVYISRLSADGNVSIIVDNTDHIDIVHDVAFPGDGSRFLSGGKDRTVFVYDVLAWLTSSSDAVVSQIQINPLRKINSVTLPMLPVREIAPDPSGESFALVGFDNPGGAVKDVNVTDRLDSGFSIQGSAFLTRLHGLDPGHGSIEVSLLTGSSRSLIRDLNHGYTSETTQHSFVGATSPPS